jgi:hypothetical protein
LKHLQEGFRITDGEAIGNAQDLVSKLKQSLVSRCVSVLLRRCLVHIAVNFDHQPQFVAIKIHNEIIDWNLAPKLEAQPSTIPKQVPDVLLGGA